LVSRNRRYADTPGIASNENSFCSQNVTENHASIIHHQRLQFRKDVKAAASIGTLLAWQSWQLLITGGFAGFLLAAIYGIALLASGRATRKQHIPLGPFLLAGAFLAVLTWH
jgi:leader peptidase (prepilin peptidase)/N-methyltransferase